MLVIVSVCIQFLCKNSGRDLPNLVDSYFLKASTISFMPKNNVTNNNKNLTIVS
jgi:hypothetical protein